MLEYEVLNVNKQTEEDKKIAEFVEKVESYINSKDKFINKDTTVDTRVKNYRNIMGHISKSKSNISIEGLGLCNVEKIYEYDYANILSRLGRMTCKESITITNIMDDIVDEIYREYMIFNHPSKGALYYMTKEITKNKTIEMEYDKLYRLISSTLYIKDQFEVQDIYEYTDHEDGSFEVEEKKKASEDTDPILISKSYVDKKHRLYRIDTATGASKRIIFDEVTDKKIREEYYQNDFLVSVIRYEIFNEETEENKIVCASMIRDIYESRYNKKSILIEETEMRSSKEHNRLCYKRQTKYHRGIKMVEKITEIEFKYKGECRIENQTFYNIDYTENEKKEYKEQNIIEFDESNRPTLIINSKQGKDMTCTVTNYDDEENTATTKNEETSVHVESFEEDPEMLKVYEQKDVYKPKTLYNRYNEFIADAVKSLN